MNNHATPPTFEERERLYYQLKFLAIFAEAIPEISEQITDQAAYGLEMIIEDMADRIFPEH